MDNIRKAVERARTPLRGDGPSPVPPIGVAFDMGPAAAPGAVAPVQDAALNLAHLESKRIIAHNVADLRSRSFDMLRTQVLQSMDLKSWQFLGVTSATEGCGKSVVAINLAMSIARQPERSVLLVDLDLQKPQVASYLGLSCDRGVVSALQGRTSLQGSVIRARARNEELLVLPCAAPTINSSELIASRAMRGLMTDIKRDFRACTVIFDLPPILSSDDVISLLPQIDCVLFVVGAGTTTAEEIKECNRHLDSAEVVRVVLNKAEDADPGHYSYPQPVQGPAPGKKPGSDRVKPVSKLLKKLGEI